MAIPINEAFDRIMQRQEQDKQNRKQQQLQRRNTVTDTRADFKTMIRGKDKLYTGFEITKDMQFIMRYTFSLHVRPFVTTLMQEFYTEDAEITVTEDEQNNHTVKPNPHKHKVAQGIQISEHDFDNKGLRISINQIDITDAIIEEYGSFVDGYGYFPEDSEAFDVLRIVEHLAPWEQAQLLGPGRKEIEISQNDNALCECEISYYIKYNHVDRGGLV